MGYAKIDENGFLVTTCPGCGSPSHPAVGCAYSSSFVFCWACTLATAKWLESFTASKGARKGLWFYAHVRPVD